MASLQINSHPSKVWRKFPELRDQRDARFEELVWKIPIGSSAWPNKEEMEVPEDWSRNFCKPEDRTKKISAASSMMAMELMEQARLHKNILLCREEFPEVLSSLLGAFDSSFESPDEKKISIRAGYSNFLKRIEEEKKKKNLDQISLEKARDMINTIFGRAGVEQLNVALQLKIKLYQIEMDYHSRVHDERLQSIASLVMVHTGGGFGDIHLVSNNAVRIDGCEFPSADNIRNSAMSMKNDLEEFNRLKTDKLIVALDKLCKVASTINRPKNPPPKPDETEEKNGNRQGNFRRGKRGGRNRGFRR